MVFGMPTLIELNDLEDTMKLCRELGLQFVELNMNLPNYQLNKLKDTKRLNQSMEEYQLFYTIHLDENLNISDFNPLVTAAYLETVEGSIDVAKQLNIPVLNMHMNPGVYFTLPDKKVRLFEKYKEIYLNNLLEFRNRCEQAIGNHNITICIENTDGFKEYEKEGVELLLQSHVFGLTWDIGHSHLNNNADEAFIMEHPDRLQHFHIHDCNHKSNHLPLGTGEIDLKERLEIAKLYNCRCVIETKTIAALKESVKWLEDFFNVYA